MKYKFKTLNRKNITLFLALAGVIAFCLAIWYVRILPTMDSERFVEVTSDTGVYDLREFDFENSVATMAPHEQFIAGELLTPEEFRLREDEAKVQEPYNSPVTTSRMIYLMPDDGRYIITDRSLDFCERIYVNGELIQEVGTVALTAEESVPHHAYLTIEVRPVNGVIEIVRQGNNFVHIGSNIAASLTLGSAERMHSRIALDYGMAGVVVALFFTLTAAHLLLYTVLSKYTSHLYFAVLSLVWGFRMGITGIVVFGEWMPTISWDFGFRLQQFTWPMASALIFLIAMHVMPKVLPRACIKAYALMCTIYAISCFFLPTMQVSITMLVFQIINVIATIALGLAAIVCLIRMACARTAKPEHYLFVVGLLPLVFSILNDTMYYLARSFFDARFEMGDLALMLFVFIQTAALLHDTGRKTEAVHLAEQQSRAEAETLKRAGEMKEEFMRNLSHELQIPIATVSGYAQFTDQLATEDEDIEIGMVKNNMRVISGEAMRLSRMVKQLLDVSAIDAGTFKLHLVSVDMKEILSKVTTQHFPVMSDGSIALITQVPEDLPLVYGDEERLLQCILNLMSNAIKYAKGKEITLSALEKDGHLEITVSDTGKGIASELLPDLFSRYPKDRSDNGNGLGLYIVAQTIEAHGGDVSIESEIEKGTKVKFTVPMYKET